MLWGLCWAQTWIMSLEIVIKAQTLEIESSQLTPQLARERERERGIQIHGIKVKGVSRIRGLVRQKNM